MIEYSAGIVTAYGSAVRAGYTGTYEDFCRQQAQYAENAQAVEQAKNTAVSAKNDAVTAKNTAVSAKDDAVSAKNTAVSAKDDAVSAKNTASTKAQEASASATSAGLSATSASQSAQNAEQSAQGVSGSLVQIQTNKEDISQLKADLDDVNGRLEQQSEFIGYEEAVNLKGENWGVGYFNTSTGEFVDCVGFNNNNSKRIVQKAIHHTDKAIKCNIASGYRYILQFWNSYDSFKAQTSWQTGEYTIPAGSYYVAGQVAQLTDSVNITDYTQNGLYDAFSMEYADGSGKGSTTTIPEQFEAIRADIDDIRDEIGVSDKTIVCFGNSLTMGATKSYSNPWPTQLKTYLPNYTIKNHGISGEGVQTIGARQGGIPMLTNTAFTIPSDTTAVAIGFTNILGGTPTPLVQGGTSIATPGVNPCSIAGVEGTLSLSNDTYYFARTTSGDAVTVNRPTPIITDSMKNDRSDILILWTGENGQFDDNYDNLIAYESLIVNYSKNTEYFIIGRSNASYTGTWGTAYNKGMMLAHGRKYINIVEYLAQYGLADLNITPTAEDETAMSNGLIPPSLKTDFTHLTTDAYGIVARLVYERGVELGYWS